MVRVTSFCGCDGVDERAVASVISKSKLGVLKVISSPECRARESLLPMSSLLTCVVVVVQDFLAELGDNRPNQHSQRVPLFE